MTVKTPITTIICALAIIVVLPGLAGAGSFLSIQSGVLNETRKIYVQLPQGYDSSGWTYPVLYFLDAHTTLAPESLLHTVADLRNSYGTPDMILVGICNTSRNRDMIPVEVVHRSGSGGSDNFLQFVGDELQPFIEKNYRTGEIDIIYGASNAGLLTVYAFLERPDLFDAYIASSPMIGHCPEFIHGKTERFIKRADVRNKKLFMIYGKNDLERATEFIPGYFDFLTQGLRETTGIKVEMKFVEDAGHVPDSSLREGLLFVFSD